VSAAIAAVAMVVLISWGSFSKIQYLFVTGYRLGRFRLATAAGRSVMHSLLGLGKPRP